MSVTLRLEGLSTRASTNDIRESFVGLDIPDGGVHIIGGLKGEAFVDVATWDNAYQALQMSGLQIRNSIIKISVISSEEKQQALENYKVKDSAHGRNGAHERKKNEGRNANFVKKYFLRLDINDFAPTEDDVRHFFDGVYIEDMLFAKKEESAGEVVVLVMFDNESDATEGYYRYKDSKIIRIRWADHKEWRKHGGKMVNNEDDCISSTSGNSRRRTHSRSPRRRTKSPRRRSKSPQKHSSSSQRLSRSPKRFKRSPLSSSRTPVSDSRSPQSQSEDQDSGIPAEYHVQVTNLSFRANKDDLRRLFHHHVCDEDIVFVYDENGHRTRDCFVTFTRKEHFRKAIVLDQVLFKGHRLQLALTSKKDMQRLLAKSGNVKGDIQAYIYLGNFPPEVTKSDVIKFFKGFTLNEDQIFLLFNKKNTCLGDVLVKFSSSKETSRAERLLDRRMFKDKQISLKLINGDRLTSFLISNGLHMISVDPNECVTQEDDPSEEEASQENDTCDDEPNTEGIDAAEDESAAHKDDSPECVSKEDD